MIASERLFCFSAALKRRLVAFLILTVCFVFSIRANAQMNWPMPGHDAQHTGRANFAGPTSAPAAPAWTFSTASPIVGDIVTSVEGTLYFASDQLYALKPDGTVFAPSVPIGAPSTGPVVDDSSGLIYIAVTAADGGFDLLSLTKQLQGAAVILHVPRPPNGAIISSLVLGRGGLVFFVAGRFPGIVYAAGSVQWSNPACPSEAGPNTPFGASANSPIVSSDGSTLFIMCGGGTGGQDGLLRLQAGTGAVAASTPTNRNSTEAALDSLQHIRSGWQAFGGAVFCGDYLTWDFSLTVLTTMAAACDSSRFTTSRAAIMPDGQSTVRIGFAFPPDNQLDSEGINNWIISTDGSAIPNFTSLPSVDAAGNVFIGNTQGIEALSPADGHTLWFFTTGDQITTQPVIANGGALYVGSSSGKVYAFNTTPAHQSGTVYVSGGGAGFATVDLLSASVTATNNTFTDGGVIAVSPDGTRSYVTAIFGLAVVDNTTNKVITTVSVGSRPAWVALSPDGSRVYVSQPNISSAPGVFQGVYVIDAATNGIIASIPIPGPQRVAVAPDNSRVYVGSGGRGIAVIDPITNTVIHSVNILGAQTTGIAFTPDGAHAYVGEFNGASVYLIDAHADVFLQTIPLTGSLGGGISGVIASPDGSKVYAGNVRNGPIVTAPRDVFVIDTATNAVTGQIPVSFPSPQFAISSDRANLLVGDSDIGNLIVASIATTSVVHSIHVNDPCCPNIVGIGAEPPGGLLQPPPAPGTLTIETNNAAATFTVVGPMNFSGTGLSFTKTVAPGSYSISFGAIQDFVTPPDQVAIVTSGSSTIATGIYTPVLTATPNPVLFSYETGSRQAIPPADVTVSSPITGLVANATADSGTLKGWLSISTSGTTIPLHITVAVAPGLKQGSYSGVITVSSSGFADLKIPVGLTVSTGSNAKLVFPVRSAPMNCRGTVCSQFTANISAVYDHAMKNPYEENRARHGQGICTPIAQPAAWGHIVDFLGESAELPDINSSFGGGSCGTLHGYRGTLGTAFLQSAGSEHLNYQGHPSTTLFYDSHPGYDYPFPYLTPAKSLDQLTPVYPAVSGCVTYQANAAGASANSFHVLGIVPMSAPPPDGVCNPALSETGYVVFYLHLASYLRGPDPVVCLDPIKGERGCRSEQPCPTCSRQGDWVSSDSPFPVAYVGNFSGGLWGGVKGTQVGPHLHLEVDKVSGTALVPLDPYGWWLATPDPFAGGGANDVVNTWLWK